MIESRESVLVVISLPGRQFQVTFSGFRVGPVLFLIFINDLDSALISSILKFADDTKLFGIVNTDVDRAVIQRCLSCLVEWSQKWLMPFNPSVAVVFFKTYVAIGGGGK